MKEIRKASATEEEKASTGGLDVTMYLFLYSFIGSKASFLFRFPIKRLLEYDDDDESKERRVQEPPQAKALHPIGTFLENTPTVRLGVVGCAAVGPFLYIIPDEPDPMPQLPEDLKGLLKFEEERERRRLHVERLPSYKFDLRTMKSEELPSLPNARKELPIVVSVGGNVYALSISLVHPPALKPCFEVYDPVRESWTPLGPTPFEEDDSTWACRGYVVLPDEGFILIFATQAGVPDSEMRSLFSYNTPTDAWKRVPFLLNYDHTWYGEAMAVDGHIYALVLGCSSAELLVSFPYEINNSGGEEELFVGSSSLVEGLLLEDLPETRNSMISGTVGRIGDRMLSVAHTCCRGIEPTQSVSVSIISIVGPTRCITLQSYLLSFPPEDFSFHNLFLSSILVMEPDASSSSTEAEPSEDRPEVLDCSDAQASDMDVTGVSGSIFQNHFYLATVHGSQPQIYTPNTTFMSSTALSAQTIIQP